jgi:hypothetical protein
MYILLTLEALARGLMTVGLYSLALNFRQNWDQKVNPMVVLFVIGVFVHVLFEKLAVVLRQVRETDEKLARRSRNPTEEEALEQMQADYTASLGDAVDNNNNT